MDKQKNKKTIRPMLMQYAEPEYMCDCGFKFYAYESKPEFCSFCGIKFDWKHYAFKE